MDATDSTSWITFAYKARFKPSLNCKQLQGLAAEGTPRGLTHSTKMMYNCRRVGRVGTFDEFVGRMRKESKHNESQFS
jgi:hypothetical protein